MKRFKEYLTEKARHERYLYGVHNYPEGDEKSTKQGKMVRELAYSIKEGKGLNIVAPKMADLIKSLVKNPVLIPIPNSKGDTSSNRKLIQAIIPHINGASIADILTSTKRDTPSHQLRKQGKVAGKPDIFTKIEPDLGPNLVLIDNVITTGNTIFATHKNLKKYSKPIAVCWAIAHDTKKMAWDYTKRLKNETI